MASPADHRRRSSAAPVAVKRTCSRLDPGNHSPARADDNSIPLDEMRRRGSVAADAAGATSPTVTGCGLGVRSNSGYVLLPTRAD